MKKTKHFVLDANMLISAFLLASTSIAAQAYYKVIAEGKIVLSDDTFNEFNDVFIRPKFDRYLTLTKRLTIIEDLKTIVQFVPITNVIKVCRDQRTINIWNWLFHLVPAVLLPAIKICWF